MAKRRTSSFRGKVAHNAKRQKQEASFDFLMYPKGIEVLEIESGTINLDFLPYKVTSENHPDRDEEVGAAMKGDLWYRRPYKIHRDIGVDSEAVICLSSIGEPCPICEYRNKMKRGGDADKDDIKALYAKSRSLYIVIPFSKKFDEEPHIFDISQYLFQDLLNDELEDDAENEIFPDPEEGKTLKVRFEKERFKGQKFVKASRIDFDERDYVYDQEMLDSLPDLDEIIEKSVLSYKEVERKFMSFSDDEDDGDGEFENVPDEDAEEETKSTSRKRKPSRKPKPKVDEDENEDEGNEQEEEEKKPRTRTRKPATRKPTTRRTAKDKCPHGHKFGVDIDEFEDCENCAVWDNCNDENKNNN